MPRLIVLVGVLVNVAGLVLMAMSTTLVPILIGRFIAGIGVGAAAPAVRRIVILADPTNLGSNLGRLLAADVFGFALGPAISALLVGPFGIKAPFLVVAAGTLALLPFVARVKVRESVDVVRRRLAVDLLRIKPFAGAVVMGSAVFVMIGTFDALWALVHRDLGTSEWIANLGITLFALPLIILGPIGGRLSQTVGPFKVATGGLLLGALFLFLYGVMPTGGAIFADRDGALDLRRPHRLEHGRGGRIDRSGRPPGWCAGCARRGTGDGRRSDGGDHRRALRGLRTGRRVLHVRRRDGRAGRRRHVARPRRMVPQAADRRGDEGRLGPRAAPLTSFAQGNRRQRPVKVAWPGPCSRKLATPMRESSEWNTSTNASRSIVEPVGERRGHPLIDRLLGEPLGLERTRRHLGGQADRPVVEFLGCHHLVGETDPERFVGTDLTAGDAHLLGPAHTDGARQSLGPTAAGDDPEQDLRLAEHRLVRRDPVVAGQGQLAAAAECVAADGGDHEARDRGDGVECGMEAGGDRGGLVGPTELGDVGSGGEDPVAAGDDDGAGRIGGEVVRGGAAVGSATPTTVR